MESIFEVKNTLTMLPAPVEIVLVMAKAVVRLACWRWRWWQWCLWLCWRSGHAGIVLVLLVAFVVDSLVKVFSLLGHVYPVKKGMPTSSSQLPKLYRHGRVWVFGQATQLQI